MLLWQALILGIIQGVSELFPVSSLGQTILIPAILGWKLDKREFLAFVVLLHLATALALLVFYWRDWVRVFRAYLGSIERKKLIYDTESKFAWMLVAGTIIVGAAGLKFHKKLQTLFDNDAYNWVVACILIANGAVMLYGDFLKRQASEEEGSDTTDPAAMAPQERKKAVDLSLMEAVWIGGLQSLALLPGISRSGVTIIGGLIAGLSYEEAARFSFMLATPVIALAGISELPVLRHPENHDILMKAIPAAILAGITAYASVKFLTRYFQHNRLAPFGYFCIAFGVFALLMIR